ncbi:Kinesin motor domain containing protein [Musa troglodytarum]|uniref:Kinesin motor domain containing protein n=1 Tax=Musa troglodytarum TaxID=320322 RepID=A0A9E7F5K0_9LILI|nr:Kinesin motor domain containing protein [Musa troglodytarum]URD88018.1 Kinesin motor domain containing protein [Musa troglodytarum]URD88019.1 Kinesin motor domain containing protein [Musa troglodytarum]
MSCFEQKKWQKQSPSPSLCLSLQKQSTAWAVSFLDLRKRSSLLSSHQRWKKNLVAMPRNPHPRLPALVTAPTLLPNTV